jgi:hypothetical protein
MKKLKCWFGLHDMQADPKESIKGVDGRWVMINSYCKRCGHSENWWGI